MLSKFLKPVASVYVFNVESDTEFCTVTFNVDVSAFMFFIKNFWSTSALSTVYLKVTKVPSYKLTPENL